MCKTYLIIYAHKDLRYSYDTSNKCWIVNIVHHKYWRQDLYFHKNSDVVELDVPQGPVIDYSEVGWGRWGQQKGNHILKDGHFCTQYG